MIIKNYFADTYANVVHLHMQIKNSTVIKKEKDSLSKKSKDLIDLNRYIL